MCKQLINRGCDPLKTDKFKKTAVNTAKLNNQLHIVEYLNTFKKKLSKLNTSTNSDSQSVMGGGKGSKKK